MGADWLACVLRTVWRRVPGRCEPLAGGMTSAVWLVTTEDEPAARYVAKLVPVRLQAQFEAGLAVAERLESAGITAGAPVRTAAGALTERLDAGVLALLRYVPGRPLDPLDPLDQGWWGGQLAAAHRALDGFTHPGLVRWHWVRPDAPHLNVEDWIRSAVAEAVAGLTKLCVTDQLTYGVLHGDPAAEAFLLDVHTGRLGLVDWGSTCTGPLVFDLASAVMYAGGPDRAADLIEAYAAAGAVPGDEIDAALPALLRFRWAVQADWFARRIAEDDRTGVAGPEENWAGLHHARDMLTGGCPTAAP